MLDAEFKLKHSKQCISLLLMIWLLAIFSLLMSSIPLGIKLSGWVILLVFGITLFLQHGLLRSADAILSLRCRADKKWMIITANNIWEAELRGDSLVTTKICILRFQVKHAFWPKSCIIFQDSLPMGQYRQLICFLKMY